MAINSLIIPFLFLLYVGVMFMLGAIIGDIVGSRFKFDNNKTTEFEFFNDSSKFTDDTVMTIAVAVGLLKTYNKPDASRDAVIDAMYDFGNAYYSAGYGCRFSLWLTNRCREPYGSYDYGSAIRVTSVGWLYDTLEDVERYAEITAAVTHNHQEGIKGAQAVSSAIFLARTGASKDQILHLTVSRYGYDLSRTLNEIRGNNEYEETCQVTVPHAIRAFLESDSFEDAIRKAVSIGGDSNTIAAMTGGIAEAYYGSIPQWVIDEAISRLDELLRKLAMGFYDIFKVKVQKPKGRRILQFPRQMNMVTF